MHAKNNFKLKFILCMFVFPDSRLFYSFESWNAGVNQKNELCKRKGLQ